jgi:hypothetical protein
MTTTVKEIIEAKRQAGEDAFLLLLSTSCRCELWPDEDSHDVCDMRDIISAWELDPIEYEQLIESGFVDCQE